MAICNNRRQRLVDLVRDRGSELAEYCTVRRLREPFLGQRERLRRLLPLFLRALSLGDVANEAREYTVPVRDQLSERDFHRKLLAIAAQRGELRTAPVQVPLPGGLIAAERTLMPPAHGLRHQHGQRPPDQFLRVETKDTSRRRIRISDDAALVRTEHHITGRLENDALFQAQPLAFLLSSLALRDIHHCTNIFHLVG